MLLDLRQGSVETIYQDNAKYNSIDWQPNTNNLLLAKGNKLLMFNVLGDTQAIDFATSNDISAAFFKHTGNGLYIEQSQLNISLMKTPSLSDNAALARLNYHSANLFPLTNPANRQWLFQSDHSGEQQLYLVDKDNETSIAKIKEALEAAVQRQLMSDVPYGVLLSGGLDSSVTSAIAKKYAQKRVESDGKKDAWWPQLHSFSVGLEGSPDLAAARKVADHIDTVHHEIKFTIQEGLDAIRDVIYNLETYDITTIRASTPMYLMARVIKSMGIKMVLSGEGADELFGGYLYFHKAPNAQEFHEETVRKLSKLHMYDCLRANKSLAAWGIEGRVPFLDKEFMDVAMSINPQDKMINGERMEKWVVRKAFEDMIPESVAWRQKEQFSDGVGYSWIDTLKEMVNDLITDEQLANAHFRFPIQTPQNKEEFYYRSIFEEHFPSDAAALCVPQEPSVACSTKIALEWDEAFKDMNDPSGRAVAKVHDDAYQEKEAVVV